MTTRRVAPKIGLLAAEEPPNLRNGGGWGREILALVPALREQQGTWFKVAEFTTASGASSQVGRMKKKAPQVEWIGRTTLEGGSVLYARYVGNGSGVGNKR